MSATSQQMTRTLWDLVRPFAGPYKPAAFCFVQEALRHTSERVFDQPDDDSAHPTDRHVTGQQLCMGIRELACEQFGPLARTVLASWGIRRTEDFGQIVFALVQAGVLRKTEQDSIEDFAGVYDFADAFGDAFKVC